MREAATAATIAAQMVLRDETHLFTLLDGLPDEKKNLLTYMFDKHEATFLAMLYVYVNLRHPPGTTS